MLGNGKVKLVLHKGFTGETEAYVEFPTNNRKEQAHYITKNVTSIYAREVWAAGAYIQEGPS